MSSSRIPTTRRTVLVGLSVAGLVGVAALSGVVSTSATAAAGDDAFNKLITIKTSSRGGTVTQYNGTTSPVTQSIVSSKQGCDLVATPLAQPVAFGGSAKVGFNSGSIGIIEKSGSGQACGQVNYLSGTEEILTIDLQGSKANIATLDMEVQKDARVVATTYEKANKTDTLRTFELQSGASVGTTSTADQLFICNVVTSSAPNSNITDNCRWLFGGLASFDVVELQALRGQFSLEGGADGTVPKAPGEPTDVPPNVSYFKLGVLCTPENNAISIGSAGSAAGLPSGSVQRYTNADGSICFDDEMSTSVLGTNQIEILKKGQPYAQYVTRIGWEKTPNTPAISQTFIQFSTGPNPTDLSAEVTLPWCPTSLFDPATSTAEPVSGDRYLALPASVTSGGLTAQELGVYGITDMDGLPNTPVQFACILDRDVNYDAGTFYVNDVIYVLGDLRMRG